LYDTADEFIDEDKQDMEGLAFFIGRNNDTIWAKKPLSKTSKVRSKNIIETIPGVLLVLIKYIVRYFIVFIISNSEFIIIK